eukprot:scaffold1514_cov199-Pinguiococcus_pyrenoidosus.AAC.1
MYLAWLRGSTGTAFACTERPRNTGRRPTAMRRRCWRRAPSSCALAKWRSASWGGCGGAEDSCDR